MVNIRDKDDRSPLFIAVEQENQAVIGMLLDKGVDPNAGSGHYGNALQTASARSHKEIVKLLLDRGANINAEGGANGTALRAASAVSNKEKP